MREQGKPQKIIHVIINQIKSPTIIPLYNKAVKSIKLSRHFVYLAIHTFLINHYSDRSKIVTPKIVTSFQKKTKYHLLKVS